MFDSGASRAMGGLVATDLTVADHAELAEAARSVSRLQAFVDHAKVQIARRTRQLAEQGDRSSDHVLIDEGRLSGRTLRPPINVTGYARRCRSSQTPSRTATARQATSMRSPSTPRTSPTKNAPI